jgi:hypothetical protein
MRVADSILHFTIAFAAGKKIDQIAYTQLSIE